MSRTQLLAAGVTRRGIEHRIERGRLHPVVRGVYAVGRPELSHRGRWTAAILACGDPAALSHRSAAALWGIHAEGEPIEVSVPAGSDPRPAGVRVHRRVGLGPEQVTRRDGIAVTRVVRTLVDLASMLEVRWLERAVNEADGLGLVDPEGLRHGLGAYGGQPGVGRLRALLDRRTFRMTDTELERRFLRIVDSLGMARPTGQKHLSGFRVDFYWADLGLVIECDGLRYHRTPAEQKRDRVRDQAHTAAGRVPLRFTHEQIRYEPDHVARTLEAVVRRLSDRAPRLS